MRNEKSINGWLKEWYMVYQEGNHHNKYSSIEEIIRDKQKYPFFSITKIIKITEEVLPQELVNEINLKVEWVDVNK